MRRSWLPIALLFIASAALAQTSADLSVAIIADQTVDGNQDINFQVDVANNGPDVAEVVQVYATSDGTPLSGCNGALVGDLLPAGSHVLVPCTAFAPGAERDIVLTAKVTTGTPDPNTANNVATRTIHATSALDLTISLRVPDVVTPGVPFGVDVLYGNDSATTATGLTVTVGIPSTAHVAAVPDNCTQSASVVTCRIGTVAPHKLPGFNVPDLVIVAVPDDASSGNALQFTGDIKGNEPEANVANNHFVASAKVFRTFYVTDTAESLAVAIDQANLDCTDDYPCKIAFRIAGAPPASGYFTVKPHRALAKITGANIFLDGSTQTQLTGDTNPNGPEIFIDGSENAWEDAIVFDEPCGGEVGFVAIGNFRNAAVTMRGTTDAPLASCGADLMSGPTVHDSYLGADPTGTTAAPNGRGVVISQTVLGGAVRNNLISGNHRSGVWIGMSHRGTAVFFNTIGIDIHHQPLANGASGVYVGPLATDLEVFANYVAFNHDFGVAIDRNAVGVKLSENSIFANSQLGIDIGLDGPTPDRDVPAPVIVSAQYDAAQNKTIVVLSAHEPSQADNPMIWLYASDAPHPSGYGDGQYFLGAQDFNPAFGSVTISAKGDWRGKWVSATLTRNDFSLLRSTTSEFSRAVKVE